VPTVVLAYAAFNLFLARADAVGKVTNLYRLASRYSLELYKYNYGTRRMHARAGLLRLDIRWRLFRMSTNLHYIIFMVYKNRISRIYKISKKNCT
jgi:hypothetical protein